MAMLPGFLLLWYQQMEVSTKMCLLTKSLVCIEALKQEFNMPAACPLSTNRLKYTLL